ncbi:MAG: response regulator [Polyangiaceae bacterium]|nr:response regulator [Polyangiaceae bacterium]
MRTVLIIDDEGDIRTVVAMSLEHVGGYRVLQAASGEEGLAVALRERPDLVMLDLMMPGMDGRATFEALRADARTRAIPVVLVTARRHRRELEGYLALGFAGVVVKPFDPMSLPGEVARIWQRSSPGSPDIEAALEELRAEYAQKLPARIAELAHAADAACRDPGAEPARAAAERLAHKLRGTSGSLGFSVLADAAGKVETLFGALLEARRGAAGAGSPDGIVAEIRAALAELQASAPRSP